MKTIYVVDDNDVNLATAEKALRKEYRVITLPSAEKMFAFIERLKPDLILLDIKMPNINGLEALKRLKANNLYKDIPVIFLTGQGNADDEVKGFKLGAVDFIRKPFTAPVLRNRIKSSLDVDELIQERTAEIRELQDALIVAMAELVESRDGITGGHVERASEYVRILVDEMLIHQLYIGELETWDLALLSSSARLHDIGKIAVPDVILNKPGKLTPEEFETMKTHTTVGEQILDKIIARTSKGRKVFLHYAKLFAGYHHERWDGNGYPYGLKGKKIPLQGRIMAIADTYDALLSVRQYKEALTEEEATSIIISEAGKQFDPEIVGVFSKSITKFKEVRKS